MGGAIDKPNVSYIEENKTIYYNPILIYEIPNNVIRYQTTDKQIITPRISGIGNGQTACTIISNTYNNYGEISFDTDVTCLCAAGASYSGAFMMLDTLKLIILPKSITNLTSWSFIMSNNLTTIICLSITPPIDKNYRFTDNSSISNIYVPDESVDSYKEYFDSSYTILPLSYFL